MVHACVQPFAKRIPHVLISVHWLQLQHTCIDLHARSVLFKGNQFRRTVLLKGRPWVTSWIGDLMCD